MNLLIDYVSDRPWAGIAFGIVAVLGFGALGATSALSATRMPKQPAPVNVAAIDPVADQAGEWFQGVWVRVIDGAWRCDAAIADGDRTYVPIGETPRSLILASVPTARPCKDWAASTPEGLLRRGRARLRTRLFGDDLGDQRLVLLTANEGAGAVIGIVAISGVMVALGVWLVIRSLRLRARLARDVDPEGVAL